MTVTLKLPRLHARWKTERPEYLQRYLDQFATSTEKAVNAILLLPDIQAAITAAQEAADNANAAADNAQAAADAQLSEQSLLASYPSFFSAPLITANSSGDVTIANHSRVYGNSTLNPTVSVTGSVLNTGLSSGSIVRVYYNDPSRAGGSVTYLYTVDPASPMPQGGNVHAIGAVEIPAIGTGDGNFVRPPGYVEP